MRYKYMQRVNCILQKLKQISARGCVSSTRPPDAHASHASQQAVRRSAPRTGRTYGTHVSALTHHNRAQPMRIDDNHRSL
jgi:hypothetical protein